MTGLAARGASEGCAGVRRRLTLHRCGLCSGAAGLNEGYPDARRIEIFISHDWPQHIARSGNMQARRLLLCTSRVPWWWANAKLE